jgi:hypothetical protein
LTPSPTLLPPSRMYGLLVLARLANHCAEVQMDAVRVRDEGGAGGGRAEGSQSAIAGADRNNTANTRTPVRRARCPRCWTCWRPGAWRSARTPAACWPYWRRYWIGVVDKLVPCGQCTSRACAPRLCVWVRLRVTRRFPGAPPQATPTHGRFREQRVLSAVLPLLAPPPRAASGLGMGEGEAEGGEGEAGRAVAEHAASVVAVLAQNADTHFDLVS